MNKSGVSERYMRFMEAVEEFENEHDCELVFGDVVIAAAICGKQVNESKEVKALDATMVYSTGTKYRKFGLLGAISDVYEQSEMMDFFDHEDVDDDDEEDA